MEREIIFIKSKLCAVFQIFAYSVDDHLFAYQLSLVPTTVSSNGIREHEGIVYPMLYVDEDGDGNFETRYSAGTLLAVPDWAKKKPSPSQE